MTTKFFRYTKDIPKKKRGFPMTNQHTTTYPFHKEVRFSEQDILFFLNFRFSYRDLLKELPQETIVLFQTLIRQFKERDDRFFITLNDEKKWNAAVKKFTHYKVKNPLFEEYFEEVCDFFTKHDSEEFVYEISNYFSIATYRTEKNSSWFLFDDYKEQLIPFSKERIGENGIRFHNDAGDEMSISPQALIYIRLIDFTLTERVIKFTLKANLDETLPEHIQLLLSVYHNKQKANTYFISYSFPLTSLLESVIGYQKLLRLLEDTYANAEDSKVKESIKSYYYDLQLQLNRLSSTLYLEYTNQQRKKEENLIATTKKKHEEAVQKLEKQKEKLDELKNQLLAIKNEQKKEPLSIKQIVSADQSEELKKRTEERDTLQAQVNRIEAIKKSDETRLLQEINNLKEENKGLQQKLQPLLKVVAQPKIETIEQWLALGKTLIQDINDVEEKEIRQFFDFFLFVRNERTEKQPRLELASNVYGYVSISSKGHHIHFANGHDERIENIPANIYLADGQFVQVTKDYEYVQDYPDFFDFHFKDASAHFSVVKIENNAPYVFLNGELCPLKVESHIQLRDGQIVSFNHQLELVRFYKQQRLKLDLFEQSIVLKGHTPYYIQKVLPTGALVTNAFTQVESFTTFSNADHLQDGQFITAHGQEIIRSFYGTFYKLSSYYKHSEIVSICDMDGDCFGKKLTREIVIIKNIPTHVSIGLDDNIRIDELNNFLEIVKEITADTDTLEQRLSRRPIHKESILTTTNRDLSYPILIVGNPSFFASYKQQLGRYGYDVYGVDGYESFSRVKQMAKDKEQIVVCTEFVSHDNMFAIKDHYPSHKVIYSERDGATQIALQLKGTNVS